jgi:hypothetical protein
VSGTCAVYRVDARQCQTRVDPQAYLADALTKIVNGHLNSQIDDLLPWTFATQDAPLSNVA